MSQFIHKHYFPPLCVLTHCWCCGLRTGIVVIAGITSFLAACGFVFGVHCLCFGVYATGTYAEEYYIELNYNNTMHKVYEKFGRAAQTVCAVGSALATVDIAEAQLMSHKSRRAKNFNLNKIGPELLRSFTADEIAFMAANLLDYGSESGRSEAREFARQYVKWRSAKLGTLGHEGFAIMSLYNFQAFYSGDSGDDDSGQKKGRGGSQASYCNAPYLIPRVNVDEKINTLRVILFGQFLLRTNAVMLALGAIELVTSLITMIVCILLLWGVMTNRVTLLVPYLIITGFFIMFNLVFVDIRVTSIILGKGQYTRFVIPILCFLSAIVIVLLILALFTVASYLFLVFTTDFYLRQSPHTNQMVASGANEVKEEEELAELEKSLRKENKEQERLKAQKA